jgi:HEAT repeat protein
MLDFLGERVPYMDTKKEITALARRMAKSKTYDEAWMLGLELQAFGRVSTAAFKYVLEHGTQMGRHAAAFWLSDEAEMVPADIFLKMASDTDSEIRFHAAYGLGYVRHADVINTLQKLLRQDASPEVRQTAAQSLFAAARLNNAVEVVIEDFAHSLKHDADPTVREEAATSLANFLKTPVLLKAVELLEKALEDKDETVRVQAKISLSVLRNEIWEELHAVSN